MQLNLGMILQASATAHPASPVLKLNEFEMTGLKSERLEQKKRVQNGLAWGGRA